MQQKDSYANFGVDIYPVLALMLMTLDCVQKDV